MLEKTDALLVSINGIDFSFEQLKNMNEKFEPEEVFNDGTVFTDEQPRNISSKRVPFAVFINGISFKLRHE